ncbi:hypothetical protein DFH09DRAFT_1477337 [Mycena vulgaris]|nr:hypothetical protein DFH09DRAFT_1477337 [Mycena vulgaris]
MPPRRWSPRNTAVRNFKRVTPAQPSPPFFTVVGTGADGEKYTAFHGHSAPVKGWARGWREGHRGSDKYGMPPAFDIQSSAFRLSLANVLMLFATNPLLQFVALAVVLSAPWRVMIYEPSAGGGTCNGGGTVIEHPPRSGFSAFVNRSFRRRIDRGRLCGRSNEYVYPRSTSKAQLTTSWFAGSFFVTVT